MPRPRVFSTPAIVLRQRKLGDADKILTLYTANRGKLDAVAKGVRRSRSKLAGHVEPLAHASFQLAKGKNLDIVTQAESIEPFAEIRDDLDRMSRALYVCELLDRFTEPHEDNFNLYRLLIDTLRRIATRPDLDTPVRFFEMRLLDALGYRPELEECVTCRQRLRAITNYWTAGGGGVVCPGCRRDEATVRPISVNAVKVLRLFVHGTWSDAARVDIDPTLAMELERAMLEYIRWVLERDVRSAAFIDAARRAVRRPRSSLPRAITPSAKAPSD
jgi:DNA repair protein RecO (recombination protein O)